LEGPFISPAKVGAQNPDFVRSPSWEEFADLQDAAEGLIAICDIAPEEEGALEFIKRATEAGVRVSVAHTCADYTQAMLAFDAGAEQITHMFNAMPGLHHRDPGPVAAALDCDWVSPELIADGIHVHPAMIRLAFKLFGAQRVMLISDSMRACGMPDGTYDLGGQQVNVAGKVATLDNGSLAGSVSELAMCVQYAVTKAGLALADAVRAASTNPARALGLDGIAGEIAPGARADVLVLDACAELKHVILRGQIL
jgi:N-acetylglucosamine-6-phosphate deacetylase